MRINLYKGICERFTWCSDGHMTIFQHLDIFLDVNATDEEPTLQLINKTSNGRDHTMHLVSDLSCWC